MQQRYGHNPTSLYHIVRHCLLSEMNLVQKAEMVSPVLCLVLLGDFREALPLARWELWMLVAWVSVSMLIYTADSVLLGLPLVEEI